MSVTVVLDGAGLQAWAQRIPPRDLLAVMEPLRRRGAGRILVPSVVTVEALTADARDATVNQTLKQVDLDESLPLSRTRAAASLRQDTEAAVRPQPRVPSAPLLALLGITAEGDSRG